MFKKSIISVIVLLLVQTAGSGAQELSGVLTTPYHRTLEFAKQENWGELEKAAQEWVAEDGANWESWYYQGVAQLRLGKAQEAVKTLSTALRLSPNKNDRLLLTIADSYANIKDWQKAENAYRSLLVRRPNNFEVWDKLHHVVEQHLQTEPPNAQEVEKSLAEVLKKLLTFGNYINEHDLWLRYATLLVKIGDEKAARSAYSHVLRLNPTNLPAVEWVFVYDVKHAAPETLDKIKARLRRLDPNNTHLNIYLAERAAARNNKTLAREYYEIVSKAENYPYQQAAALVGLGDLTGIGEEQKALAYYKQALNANPAYVRAWEQIGIILRAKNQSRQARKYFSRMRRVKQLLEEGKEVPRKLLYDNDGQQLY